MVSKYNYLFNLEDSLKTFRECNDEMKKKKIMQENNVDLIKLAMHTDMKLASGALTDKEKELALSALNIMSSYYQMDGYDDSTYIFFMEYITKKRGATAFETGEEDYIKKLHDECIEIIRGEAPYPGTHIERQEEHSRTQELVQKITDRVRKSLDYYTLEEIDIEELLWEIDKTIFIYTAHSAIKNGIENNAAGIMQLAEKYSILVQKCIACFLGLSNEWQKEYLIRYLGTSVE